jgi:hypothetical protein
MIQTKGKRNGILLMCLFYALLSFVLLDVLGHRGNARFEYVSPSLYDESKLKDPIYAAKISLWDTQLRMNKIFSQLRFAANKTGKDMNGAQIQLKDDQKLLKQDAGGN